eukprot:7830955-Alexandrium_andersonii.AAC.1
MLGPNGDDLRVVAMLPQTQEPRAIIWRARGARGNPGNTFGRPRRYRSRMPLLGSKALLRPG